MHIEPVLVPINGTCAALGVGRNKVYDLIKEGKLEVVKIGRRTLVKTDSIKAMAQAA
jgi:excisionase family DNA binding protein